MASGSHAGRTVGNWRLERLLGEGGFGAVYAAQNVVVVGRRAAVKVLHAEMAVNADIKRRFINEASAASSAEHENIIQVFDAGVADDGTCYIVMELLAGRSLAETLRFGALDPPARVINIGLQVASALEAAHRIDIVHRDLKPDNIFLLTRSSSSSSGTAGTAGGDFVKVLDFGVAKLRGDFMGGDGSGRTKTGTLIGTPGYMSPEQWKGVSDLDGRSDVYALGMILFECVVGRLPFSGNTTYEWLYAHLNEPVPDVMTLAPACPPGLASAIAGMLEKEREQRVQSMTQVIELLRAAATVNPAERATVMAPGEQGIANLKTIHPQAGTRQPRGAPTPQSQSQSQSQSRSQPQAHAGPVSGPHGTALLNDENIAAADAARKPPTPKPLPPPPGRVPSGVGELQSRTPPPSRRSPLALPLVIVAVGALLGVGGFLLFRPKPEKTIDKPHEETAATNVVAPPPPPPVEKPPARAPDGTVAFAGGLLKMGRDDYGMPSALDVPAHDVKVGAFALARAEVTNRDFAAFLADPAHGDVTAPWKSPREPEKHGDLPVVAVGHDAAARYCAWKLPRGRLPTEMEWEWAARGKAGRLYPWGDTMKNECVNGLAGDKGAPSDASKHACGATPEGLVDLAGNVWEWTSSPAAAYPGAMVSAPPGQYFVVRGGSFYNVDPNELTATARQFVSAPNRYLGFRCAADL